MRQKVDFLEEGSRLDLFLKKKLPQLSRSKIQKLIKEKQIICTNNDAIDGATIIKREEVYQILSTDLKQKDERKPYGLPLAIEYEDDFLVVVKKPAGLVTHPGIGNIDRTLVNALVSHFGRRSLSNQDSVRPGIVHRLDKETSGFLIVAKNDEVGAMLCQMIKDRKIKRHYIAIVHAQPKEESGTIKTFIKPKRNRKAMSISAKSGKLAITHYKFLKYFKEFNISAIECELETGRTHQIRLHMQYIGNPVVGDKLYGLKNDLDFKAKNHGLFAYKLNFYHPITQKEMSFKMAPDLLIKDFILKFQKADSVEL